MLARIHRSMKEREGGFTLIELLVVMIIIGILAAIAIPVFLNQRDKAKDTSAKADATTIGKDLASYYVDGTAATTVSSTAAGGTWKINDGTADVETGKLSAGNTATGKGVDDSNWCVKVVSGSTAGTVYFYSSTDGLTSGTGGSATACSGL